MIRGRVLHAGIAEGKVLHLDAALSFWGGFDAETGLIIDRAHPQVGESLTGKVVVMPGSRGSSATPGVLAESIRLGTGPAAIVVTEPDINLTAGALVAAALYGETCAVILVGEEAASSLVPGSTITVSIAGALFG